MAHNHEWLLHFYQILFLCLSYIRPAWCIKERICLIKAEKAINLNKGIGPSLEELDQY